MKVVKTNRKNVVLARASLLEVISGYRYVTIKDRNREYIRTLMKKGFACAHCGVEGQYFAVLKNPDGFVFYRLYGVDAEGDEVELTLDHIYPKSKGGKNGQYNLQPLCMPCNMYKSDTIPERNEEGSGVS
jgi:5-methylcytosine-specific restriction endonuclease McrA